MGISLQQPISGDAAPRGNTTTSTSSTLETHFALAELNSSKFDRHIIALKASARLAKSASKVGDVKALTKCVQMLREANSLISASIEELETSARRDFRQSFDDGSFAQEVQQLAASLGLRGVRVVDRSIMSYPIIVRLSSDDVALYVAKKRSTAVRPSVVVAELVKARSAKTRSSGTKMLDAVEKAYTRVTNGSFHVAARIADVHAELTPLPAQDAD